MQTKTRIRYTALEMGYDFQKIKRNRAVQTGEIGVLIGNINSLSAQDFYFNLLEALDKECADREIAAHLYGIYAEMGIRIPEDLSVIGFDNQPICKRLSPQLTSVDYDIHQVARHAFSILETAMRYPNASTCAITVDTRVIKRDSVSRPKK